MSVDQPSERANEFSMALENGGRRVSLSDGVVQRKNSVRGLSERFEKRPGSAGGENGRESEKEKFKQCAGFGKLLSFFETLSDAKTKTSSSSAVDKDRSLLRRRKSSVDVGASISRFDTPSGARVSSAFADKGAPKDYCDGVFTTTTPTGRRPSSSAFSAKDLPSSTGLVASSRTKYESIAKSQGRSDEARPAGASAPPTPSSTKGIVAERKASFSSPASVSSEQDAQRKRLSSSSLTFVPTARSPRSSGSGTRSNSVNGPGDSDGVGLGNDGVFKAITGGKTSPGASKKGRDLPYPESESPPSGERSLLSPTSPGVAGVHRMRYDEFMRATRAQDETRSAGVVKSKASTPKVGIVAERRASFASSDRSKTDSDAPRRQPRTPTSSTSSASGAVDSAKRRLSLRMEFDRHANASHQSESVTSPVNKEHHRSRSSSFSDVTAIPGGIAARAKLQYLQEAEKAKTVVCSVDSRVKTGKSGHAPLTSGLTPVPKKPQEADL